MARTITKRLEGGSMDFPGPTGYRVAVFMKAVGEKMIREMDKKKRVCV